MKVYVEANFVLEAVFEQEEHQACAELMELAASKSIELAVPSYALLEPYERLTRRTNRGQDTQRALQKEELDLMRTASLADAEQLKDAVALIVHATNQSWAKFQAVRRQLLEVSRVLAVDGVVLREAERHKDRYRLELPDAVMLASVSVDAKERTSPSLFLNRNYKDFEQREIRSLLKELRCDLIPSFSGGLARIRHIPSA
jgi:predicted nucleic acid-binding protein